MKKIPYILIFALTLCGCEDFLDARPEATTDVQGTDYTKSENIFLPVSAAYASLRSNNMHGFSYIGMFEIVGDDADKGSTASDNPPMADVDNFAVTPTNTLLNDFWVGCYDAVSAANFAVGEMPKFEEALLNAENKQYARECRAEARVIRAYAYFMLARAFGRVYLADRVYSSDELSSLPQASVKQVYELIERDLDSAISVLPESYGKEWAGRLSRYSALALKAKVHLHQPDADFPHRWDSVATCAGKVIASRRYSLMSSYRDVFRSQGENGSESLLEIQSSTLGRTTGEATYLEYAFYQGPRGNKPTNMQGWGFCVPSQKLRDFLALRGDTQRAEVLLMPAGTTYEGSPILAIEGNPPYYNGKVFSPPSENKWSYNGYGFDYNVRVLRYADVLLMYAEALARGATPYAGAGTADEALHQVRSRVGLADVATTTENILDERRAELALEQDRYFDLIRQGEAAATAAFAGTGFSYAKHRVFPIPSNQRQLNSNLEQNPLY
ncbi:MAG: RagB/SusD family nutrient uptake outer membrane protein [Prevotellaceae bacterium]|jgi:hypothetical protein|nr:RagB/SusD family nutrient uptake outer membrane protein [Prevotellaceae bacterium]